MSSRESVGERKILAGVHHVIIVLSGKGGVGKSTVATQLAFSLQRLGKKVGLLDIDLCGPSIPRMLNLEAHQVHQCAEGWVPVYTGADQTLGVMSIGFLLPGRTEPVIWRGPKKHAMIRQFLTDVCWKDVDYLIIDTPPGTSDEHIAVVEQLQTIQPDGAVLVTTPQAVSVADVRRELTFCRKASIPVLGIIENMSGFICPTCTECTNIFSSGGGKSFAENVGIPFLGALPLDPNLSQCGEEGQSYIEKFNESPLSQLFLKIANTIISQ